MTQSRRMRWAGHVARREEKFVREFVGKPQGHRSLGRARRIILKWLLEKQSRTGNTFIFLKTQVEGCFEHCNEP